MPAGKEWKTLGPATDSDTSTSAATGLPGAGDCATTQYAGHPDPAIWMVIRLEETPMAARISMLESSV
jgi:hypothetical protein